jgi:hypothetical protein
MAAATDIFQSCGALEPVVVVAPAFPGHRQTHMMGA